MVAAHFLPSNCMSDKAEEREGKATAWLAEINIDIDGATASVASSLPTNMGPPMAIRSSLQKTKKSHRMPKGMKGGEDKRDMCFLLLLSGDIETNPGPPKSPAKRVKPPTEKEIMEGRVTNHDERLAALEKLVKEQKVVIDEMTKTQVELKTALDDSKVEFEKSVEENKVVSTSLEELKVKMKTSVEEKVCTKIHKNMQK